MVDTVTAAPPGGPDASPARRGRWTSDGHRLYWWAEILAILAFYAVYSAIRNANEGGTGQAFANARSLIHLEQVLGISVERGVQHAALRLRWFVVAMNYVYGSLHFVVTVAVVVYLFRRHSDDYPLWRNTLAVTTSLALVGFITWPLMPPRLLDHYGQFGFVDTLARYPTFWSFDSGAVSKISNQYAAMPSLHMAWAAFCSFALVPRVRRLAWKVAFALYPVLTLVAITVTANHYLLDAVGGLVVLGMGYGVARGFTRAGRGARVPDLGGAP